MGRALPRLALAATVFAALLMTLVLPADSTTKAAYALTVAPVLALPLAESFVALRRSLDALAVLFLLVAGGSLLA